MKIIRRKVIFSLVVALIFLSIGFTDIYYGTISATWPSTSGTVIDRHLFGHTGKRFANIDYIYQVKNKDYIGYRVCYGAFNYGPQDFYNYPENSPVTVFYNPSNPRQSVLEPGVSFFSAILACASGIAAFVIGLRWLLKD